jgi:voltage-gated potassium channel
LKGLDDLLRFQVVDVTEPRPAGLEPEELEPASCNSRATTMAPWWHKERTMSETTRHEAEEAEDERWVVLQQLEEWLELPMIVFSFVWLLLVLAELIWGQLALLVIFGTVIWIIFIADFLVRLVIAPRKFIFLRNNVITIFALIVPALRMFRAFYLFRAARAARGLTLVRIVGTANRSMNALKRSLRRRGLGYVLLVTLAVALLGAAGMLNFEPARQVEGGFQNYAEALWWTAMLLTTMGSDFWPVTAEGRLLTLLVSLYGFAVFGYITASFATFFIGQEAQDQEGDVPGLGDIAGLREEINALRAEIRQSSAGLGPR